jgi:hypothetical protein
MVGAAAKGLLAAPDVTRVERAVDSSSTRAKLGELSSDLVVTGK